ncbi:MAG: hypothetical protein WD801_11260 [Gemmatimonadaceae bacterium]
MRSVVATALLLLPAVSSAQRVPIPNGRGPARPAPLPPQPPAVARELSYVRLPVSVESYPMVSRFETIGFSENGITSWTSFGMGTRADLRVTRLVSATLDMTSSVFGGPAQTQTVEIGTRLRPERNERRLYPFADVRMGYVHSYDGYFRPYDLADPYVGMSAGVGSRYSQGVGVVGGVGMEYALTRTLSLTASASTMRARMTTYRFTGAQPSSDRYRLTSYRYIAGLRFNPVRYLARQQGAR